MKMVFRAKFESSQTTKFQECPKGPILIPGIRLHGNWAFESYRASKNLHTSVPLKTTRRLHYYNLDKI